MDLTLLSCSITSGVYSSDDGYLTLNFICRSPLLFSRLKKGIPFPFTVLLSPLEMNFPGSDVILIGLPSRNQILFLNPSRASFKVISRSMNKSAPSLTNLWCFLALILTKRSPAYASGCSLPFPSKTKSLPSGKPGVKLIATFSVSCITF